MTAEYAKYASVMRRVLDHQLIATLQYNIPNPNFVGIFLQGSQNYKLDTPKSDVDTKMIVIPRFEDIINASKPISTSHICKNEEHIDVKDIRLMLHTLMKQNVNFIEILFTPYYHVNELYYDIWVELLNHREQIAHYNPYLAVKTMRGQAYEKAHAMEHEYPSKVEVIKKYGYDPKQLHHLIRILEFTQRYLAGERYEDCLRSRCVEFLTLIKNGAFDLDTARAFKEIALAQLDELTAPVTKESNYNITDHSVEKLLNDAKKEIMSRAMRTELMNYRYREE